MQAVSKTAKITLFPPYGTIMPQPSAQQILHEVFGYPEFRGKQEAVVNTLAGGGSLMVLMPTGGGKSLCYQIPALMREGFAADCADERPSGESARRRHRSSSGQQ